MAKNPTSIEIREYQVGFGDCILLSFVYTAKDSRHVLIDFGTTELPARGKLRKPAKASDYMPLVAKDIATVCGKEGLTAVVATHRHADHISGFATDARTGDSGSIIRKLKPKVVLQPWTEDPQAAKDARCATRESSRSRKGFVRSLASMQEVATVVAAIAQRSPKWMSASLQRELAFVGSDNIRNESAVKNLAAMGEAGHAKAVWAHHGSPSGLEKHLPGVKVSVLGPPDLKQTEKIRTMRKTDPDQFWHLLAGSKVAQTAGLLVKGAVGRGARPKSRVPPEARWFSERLRRMRGQELLQIVRSLDEQMNNTSLILLFETQGKKLLFPGDAQIENWTYALKDAPDAKKTRRALRDVDVYKVGHHGSLNATPKKLLWENFGKRGKQRRLQTLLSTLPGKHGSTRSKTEVPRRTLVAALQNETTLLNTNALKFGKQPELNHKVTIALG